MSNFIDPHAPPTSGADGMLCVKCAPFFLHGLKEVATEIILGAKTPTANSESPVGGSFLVTLLPAGSSSECKTQIPKSPKFGTRREVFTYWKMLVWVGFGLPENTFQQLVWVWSAQVWDFWGFCCLFHSAFEIPFAAMLKWITQNNRKDSSWTNLLGSIILSIRLFGLPVLSWGKSTLLSNNLKNLNYWFIFQHLSEGKF